MRIAGFAAADGTGIGTGAGAGAGEPVGRAIRIGAGAGAGAGCVMGMVMVATGVGIAAGAGAGAGAAARPSSCRTIWFTITELSSPQTGQTNETGVVAMSGVISNASFVPQGHCIFMGNYFG